MRKARNSIGLVLVTGMTIGTAFTLFFVPAIYMLIAKDRKAQVRARANGSLQENTTAGEAA